MKQVIEYNIGLKTFFWVVVFLLGGFLAWKLLSVIIITITALMLAATLAPAVNWLNKRFSLTMSAVITLLALVLPFLVVLIALIPLFINQSFALAKSIVDIVHNYKYLPSFVAQIDFAQYTAQGGQYLLESTAQFTTFVVEVVVMLFMAFYILIDAPRLNQLFFQIIPKDKKIKAEKLLKELSAICGQYIRGNIIISVICAIAMYIGLSLLGVPSALPLAIFAGIFDLLPNIGATIGTIPAAILGFTVSPIIGLGTLALYVSYQFVENNILAPNIYNKTLHLIPFLNFIAVIIGTLLLGVAGAFLALPIAASLQTVINFLHDSREAGKKSV